MWDIWTLNVVVLCYSQELYQKSIVQLFPQCFISYTISQLLLYHVLLYKFSSFTVKSDCLKGLCDGIGILLFFSVLTMSIRLFDKTQTHIQKYPVTVKSTANTAAVKNKAI